MHLSHTSPTVVEVELMKLLSLDQNARCLGLKRSERLVRKLAAWHGITSIGYLTRTYLYVAQSLLAIASRSF